MPHVARPVWWEWELDLSPHLYKRMVDRRFSEVDVRLMLEEAEGVRPDVEPGRWVADARHAGASWQVILEPDESRRLLVVVTAYAVE